MSNAIGHHVWLRCPDWEAAGILAARLDDVVATLEMRPDLTVRVSEDGLADSSPWV
jgi:hypothetical protein